MSISVVRDYVLLGCHIAYIMHNRDPTQVFQVNLASCWTFDLAVDNVVDLVEGSIPQSAPRVRRILRLLMVYTHHSQKQMTIVPPNDRNLSSASYSSTP